MRKQSWFHLVRTPKTEFFGEVFRIGLPESATQIMMVLSLLPEAIRGPFGENTTELTPLVVQSPTRRTPVCASLP
ncbi:hypothetical protein PILCRDRAFT_814645 [Piloderma croceum F 1598]|uniref:Uncharacterized protein n=1 Tax=Piloderma croceum (strain F 1598) TaxID=765440 RepID=A0A0C3G849_PILCF|nr:hypothetical protein PILCRDRAFT_814645 [Piloderma croceum F 1598]